ncbi:MAG: hypothetical protein EZS28_020735 [Streblomastix strix]|uniref:Uncharacterized protein n=1 Tax=Streblomastix strix TaxID=222440 RepID=A0A5J4VM72_9EUKA|nr:MAG: hypothetical protein EZS28_020735 [Streblomastix strix]
MSVMESLDSLTYTVKIYQSIPETVICLIIFAVEQIIDSGTLLQASVNGVANPEINITKLSTSTPPHNVNRSDGFGENICGTQLQAATNENEHLNHQTTDKTDFENSNVQANDNRTGGQQNNQVCNNETHHDQDNGNNKERETSSSHTIHSKQEQRNSNISQSKGQPSLINTPTEIGQVKGNVVVPKQRMQPTNDHDIKSKTGQLKFVLNKSLGIPDNRANSDSSNHFIPQLVQRKKVDVAAVTKDKSAKYSKNNVTNVRSKKQKQAFNSETQIEIEPDSKIDLQDQLD